MRPSKRKIPPAAATQAATKQKITPRERTFYADTLLQTFQRLQLSPIIILLFKSLDEVRQGIIQEDDLGRKIRLSAPFRKALLDTISQCTETMVDDSSEADECSMIIKKCTNMIEISSTPLT